MNADFDEFFRDKQVLITGGIGFIGSNLARRLVQLGARVCLLDSLHPQSGGNPFNIADIRQQVEIITADVRDRAQLARIIPAQDYLFNLAAQVSHLGSLKNPRQDLQINAASQIPLLEICRKTNPAIRIAYAGTRQVYGSPQYLPVDEKHPIRPADYNGISKIAAEWYHLLAHNLYGLWVSSLRLTNTYGPGLRVRDADKTFLGDWIRRTLTGEEIRVFGDGTQIRDFNYVDDVVAALLLCVTHPAAVGQIYNLGGDEPTPLLEIARMLIEINGSGAYRLVPFPPERKKIEIGSYYGDYTKIRTQLGWQPHLKLRAGLTQTLAYYRQNREHYW